MSGPSNTLSPEYIAAYSGGQLVAVAVSFIPIILVFVCLRFYSRYLSKTSWGPDDYLVLVSLVLQIGASALAICFVKYGGVGHHLDALEETNPPVVTEYFKYLLAVSFYYFAMVGVPKLAILAFYMRIFTTPVFRNLVYLLAMIVISTGIVCPIMALNLCRPFEFNWDRSIPGGSCFNETAFYRWGSLPNIITDVAILILPMPIVWKLHTSRNMKVGLTLTFLTGSIGLATSILRFDSFFKGNAITDGTWASVDLMTWTLVEPDVYLIASCLPTYRPLLTEFLSRTGFHKQTTPIGSGKSSGSPHPSQSIGSKGVSGSKKSSSGFRRLGKNDWEDSHGGTLLTMDAGDDERLGAGDQIRLVNLNKSDLESVAESNQADVELGLGHNEIRVRNDYSVRTE